MMSHLRPEVDRRFQQNSNTDAHHASLMQAILESTADGLLVIDLDGHMVLYNDKFVKLWGIPERILKSKSDQMALRFVLAQLKNPEAFVRKVEELYQEPHLSSYDLLEFRNGRVCERFSQPQVLDKKIVGRVWSFRDVTEKRNAEQAIVKSKGELESILSSISDFVWGAFIEPGGKLNYRFYSSPVEKITGRSASFYMEGPERLLSTVHPDDLEHIKAAVFKLTSGESFHEVAEYRIFHPDGRIVYIRDSVNACHLDNGTIRLDGVSSDITHQKYAEAHQQHLFENESQMRAGAEKAVEERDLFISIASHELKNPLSNLQLRIELLNRAVEGQDSSLPLKSQLQGCRNSVEKFKQLINELLDLSKIRAGGWILKKEKISLTDLLRELVAQSCEGFEKKGCLLVLKIEDQVDGNWDKLKLGQVITNLLSNASKYGSGNTVEIGLQKKNGKAILEIKDHGIGMTPENIKNLFQPYSRFAEESSITGLGLGLYISEQIIQAHGGQITVESSLGVGSLFRVELPLEPSTS